MKKSLLRFLSGFLVVCMLFTLIPDITVKAADEELPTIEELCEKVDPVIANMINMIQKPLGASWASLEGRHWSTLSGFLRSKHTAYSVQKINDGYRIVNDRDTNIYIDLIFDNDKLVKVNQTYRISENKYFMDTYNAVSGAENIPFLNCTEHEGRHYYILSMDDKKITYCYYTGMSMIYEALLQDADVKGMYGLSVFYNQDVEPGKMYYRDSDTKTMVECSNVHGEKHICDKSRNYWSGITATCIVEGVKRHDVCAVCDADLDENGNVADFESFIIPIDPDNHAYCFNDKYQGEYFYDTEYHWSSRVCDHDVPEFSPKVQHEFDSGKCYCSYNYLFAATRVKLGDNYDGEYAVPGHNDLHVVKHYDEKKATCVKEGVIEYDECRRCDKKFDKEGNIVEDTVLPVDSKAHSFVDGVCEYCGQEGSDEDAPNGTVSDNNADNGNGTVSDNNADNGNGEGHPGQNDGSVSGNEIDKDHDDSGIEPGQNDGSVSGNEFNKDDDKPDQGQLDNDNSGSGSVIDDSSANPETEDALNNRIIRGTDYDTLEVSEILKANGKFKSYTVSENNGILTVNAGTKLLMLNSNWTVKGYFNGRITTDAEAQAAKWDATDGSKSANKALKKYVAVKFSKKSNTTKITTKANKKVAGSVYAVKLVDDKGNTIILNIERDEINKAVKKVKLTKSVSANSVSENALATMKDGSNVKTVNLSLAKLSETAKSRFNNNAVTWKLGSGKKAVKLEVNKLVTVSSKKGTVAYVMLTDDANVKVLSGNAKGTVKLSATIDRKSFKTSIKVK